MPMAYLEGNPKAPLKVVTTARAVTMIAGIVMPTAVVVVMTAARAMHMLMIQVEMSDPRHLIARTSFGVGPRDRTGWTARYAFRAESLSLIHI